MLRDAPIRRVAQRRELRNDWHMWRLGRAGATVVLAVALMAGGAAGASKKPEIYDPNAPQPPTKPVSTAPEAPASTPAPAVSPLVGTWARLDKGNPTCGRTTMTVRSTNGRLSGTTSTKGGKVSQFEVRGRDFSFVEDYTDLLGNPVSIRYSGQLSADGESATASISGSWQDGCTSTFTRLN